MEMNKEVFLELLPSIRKVARELGYAIGLHGSLARDYDLIACPWTSEAVEADVLADAIFEISNAVRWRVHPKFGSSNKPHGRVCYAFDWDKNNYENKNYCDLSVMPKLTTEG